MPRIVLDAMGGDDAPAAPVAGALEALRDLNVDLTLVGPTSVVEAELSRHATSVRLQILDAPEVIGMAESPVQAVRAKKQSSMVIGVDHVARGEGDAFVTAGNTGAAMAAAVFGLKRIEGIDRPAMAIPFPTRDGACLLLDVGANSEARAQDLVDFALMGSIYAEHVLGLPRPRVGLLNIGEEETKGSIIVQEAHQKLRGTPLNFVGNVEGKDIPSGVADVVVMDGFVGNVLIKFAEGVTTAFAGLIRSELRSSPLTSLLALPLMPAFARVRQRVDYAEWGGAPLLGVNGVVIIGHGRSNPRAIRSAIRVAAEAVEQGVVTRIRDGLRQE
jgi:glycerol-3-phosphate acyltransferase PlsX